MDRAQARESREGRKGAIETFIIDWPVLAALGFVFSAFAPQERWWRSRAFKAGLVAAAVFTTTALISYVIAPDWMWMYFLDPSDVSWTVPFIAPAYLFVYASSFAAGVALAQGSRSWTWAAAVASLMLEAAVVAVTWDRYREVGTRAEWLDGTAHQLLTAAPTGPARTIGLLGPVFVVVLVATLIVAIRGRRATAAGR